MRHRRIDRGNSEYPQLLAEIPGAPKTLYLSGKRLEPAPAIAVVGTRRASRYGMDAARWICGQMASSGITIVSGMAKGIDAAAHWGAIEAGGSTVAVLGCGLDICYPGGNRSLYERLCEAGTLVSEYEAGTPALRHHFPLRNRIIAGMTLGTVIVEAKPQGGALITARLSAEFAREVFALPGQINSPVSRGSHDLIRDGARLITCADDVLEDLGLVRATAGAASDSVLDPDECRVMGFVEAAPIILDQIARRCGMPASTAMSVLARLELKGLVSRHPGGRFALPVG